ncbi:CDAN1-interacting nuclease 1-like isoform X1 [Daphnia pulex]|uniref:CDAN1-interacting nuclease 1-like isoform X1 n=1 Tax=Daphnia pulex TaxID=6669 RepID=UPI001EDD1B76|nr:CDAN1-interacting nuclease 1-like isoform X1 [Daphnia pulex]XP_046653988.1 CDAN1-interacting nuclease 1-like isoform X1 [Daphnia pulicaria]
MARVISKTTYSSLLDSVYKLPYRNRVQTLQKLFPQLSVDTLKCVVAQECQRRMKGSHGRLTTSEAVEVLYKRYTNSISMSEEPGILIRLSDENGLTPALLARSIIERHYQKSDKTKPAKLLVSTLMKNTALIDDRDLAFETYLCLLEDDEYGPIAEATKQSVGYEYEIRLRMELEKCRVSFLHEEHLRVKGYDKTPDIKLEIPVGMYLTNIKDLYVNYYCHLHHMFLKFCIAVDGQVINWIESKALFGDEEVHRGYLKDQLYSYWNRFGPGLVIYWFGYVEDLEKIHQNRIILIRDALPMNMIFMEQNS